MMPNHSAEARDRLLFTAGYFGDRFSAWVDDHLLGSSSAADDDDDSRSAAVKFVMDAFAAAGIEALDPTVARAALAGAYLVGVNAVTDPDHAEADWRIIIQAVDAVGFLLRDVMDVGTALASIDGALIPESSS